MALILRIFAVLVLCVSARAEVIILTRSDLGALLEGPARHVDLSGPRKIWSDDAREYERDVGLFPARFPAVVDVERGIVVDAATNFLDAVRELDRRAIARDPDAVAASTNLAAVVAASGGTDARSAFAKARARLQAAQSVQQVRAASLELFDLLAAQSDTMQRDRVRAGTKGNRP